MTPAGNRPGAPTRFADTIGSTLVLAIGLAMVCVAVAIHWLSERNAKVEMVPLIVGFILALGAALWKDPRRAKEVILGVTTAGDRAVDSVTRLRTGRERGAPVVEITKTSDADAPGANPETIVSVKTSPVAPAATGAPSAPRAPVVEHTLELPPPEATRAPASADMESRGEAQDVTSTRAAVPQIFPLPTGRSD